MSPRWHVRSEDFKCRPHPALDKTLTSLYDPFPAAPGGAYEDMALLLAQYYNLPALSHRNALFSWLARNNATRPAAGAEIGRAHV